MECFTHAGTTASRGNTKGMQRLIAADACIYENSIDIGELRSIVILRHDLFADISWRATSQTPRRWSRDHIDAPDSFTALLNSRSIAERKTRQNGPEMGSLVI